MTSVKLDEFRSNFPFEEIRSKQYDVLHQICNAFNDGYRYIVLEAPTGFGKSPVAIAVARALGSSYICSATKDLQTQYVNDFPFLKAVKGMGEYTCLVREDFILNDSYACDKCKINQVKALGTNSIRECNHKSVEYGPCRSGQIGYEHSRKECDRCSSSGINDAIIADFHEGCRYKTFLSDYEITNANTDKEDVILSASRSNEYLKYSISTDWMHNTNRANPAAFNVRTEKFTPCAYYDQLNKGIAASHSIFNYANFLIFTQMQKSKILQPKKLLVLDEGHQIESQIVDQIGITISKKTLQRYMPTHRLENIKYNYNDTPDIWLVFLWDLSTELNDWILNKITSKETIVDAKQYLLKLDYAINEIEEDKKNWIVSNINVIQSH